MRKITWVGYVLAAAATVLSGCASTVKNYGLDDHFSGMEAASGASSTPEQCAHTNDAVWVEGASFRECIRYFPSKDFNTGTVRKVIVFMAGDILSTNGVSTAYPAGTPRKRVEKADLERSRGGTAYLIMGRPGTDGSSGNQNWRRTQYETLVMNAALDKIKSRYGIQEYGLIGQSGGGGLVAALIAERQDVLCAVSSSGVTAVKYRVVAAGRSSDYTGKSMAEIWDPVEQLDRVHPMPGFRMFVTSDEADTDVGFRSQDHYVQAAKKLKLPITQIMVHASGSVHHQTFGIGNRVVEDCMLGLSTDYIFRTYSGMSNDYPSMEELAHKARAQTVQEGTNQGREQAKDK